MIVMVPSRGRPQNIARLWDAWTATGACARLWVCVDNDDERLADYLTIERMCNSPQLRVLVGERLKLAGTLNERSVEAARLDDRIGFMGDDHLPRTVAWDDRVNDALDHLKHGIVYCNDLVMGAALPSQVFMTSDIVRTLGYFCPPNLVHMYVDNAWRAWGERMGRYMYLENVTIEHVHPITGQVTRDETYLESDSQMGPDSQRFQEYIACGLDADVAKLQELIRV